MKGESKLSGLIARWKDFDFWPLLRFLTSPGSMYVCGLVRACSWHTVCQSHPWLLGLWLISRFADGSSRSRQFFGLDRESVLAILDILLVRILYQPGMLVLSKLAVCKMMLLIAITKRLIQANSDGESQRWWKPKVFLVLSQPCHQEPKLFELV